MQVLVIDESPNTGNTFHLMVNLLRKRGVAPNRIFLLAAMHPARPDWCLPVTSETRGIKLIRSLEANRSFTRTVFSNSSAVQPLLAESYFQSLGWDDAQLVHSSRTDALNVRLEKHFPGGWLPVPPQTAYLMSA